MGNFVASECELGSLCFCFYLNIFLNLRICGVGVYFSRGQELIAF